MLSRGFLFRYVASFISAEDGSDFNWKIYSDLKSILNLYRKKYNVN